MDNGFRDRFYSYFSGLVYPVYVQYKLKPDTKYAIQRFCSIKMLSEKSIHPKINDYELYSCGILLRDESIEKMIESTIYARNTENRKSFSVGDVIKVFCAGGGYYFVDSVGLQRISNFKEEESGECIFCFPCC